MERNPNLKIDNRFVSEIEKLSDSITSDDSGNPDIRYSLNYDLPREQIPL